MAIAVKVTYSKLRGLLFPSLALPDGRAYRDDVRQVSFIIDGGEHDSVALSTLVETIAAQDGGSWEVCICARPTLEPAMALLLQRLRGTQPWIRIVSADATVDSRTAAQRVIEQATGQFIMLVAPRYRPDAKSILRLLDQLHLDPELDAAALVGAGEEGCLLAVQRKSGYLASQSEQWPLAAPALARHWHEAGVRTAHVRAD